jgi:hypothetical protein
MPQISLTLAESAEPPGRIPDVDLARSRGNYTEFSSQLNQRLGEDWFDAL